MAALRVRTRAPGCPLPTGSVWPRMTSCTCLMPRSTMPVAVTASPMFEPGTEVVTVPLAGLTVGLAICYDLRFPSLASAAGPGGGGLDCVPSVYCSDRCALVVAVAGDGGADRVLCAGGQTRVNTGPRRARLWPFHAGQPVGRGGREPGECARCPCGRPGPCYHERTSPAYAGANASTISHRRSL